LFPPLDNVQEYLGQLKRMQLDGAKELEGEERRITMLMVAGGHFAGMVVGIKPRGKGEKQDIKGSGDVRVIKSKTFHRYTSTFLTVFIRLSTDDSSKEARWFSRT
jgi:hypothetical protein